MARPPSSLAARPPSAGRVLKDAEGRPLQRHLCPTCHKSFHWLCYLKRHMLTHAEKEADKYYVPPAPRQAPARHVLTRAELRPYVCDACEADFDSQTSLMRHINSEHGYPAQSPMSQLLGAAPAPARSAASCDSLDGDVRLLRYERRFMQRAYDPILTGSDGRKLHPYILDPTSF